MPPRRVDRSGQDRGLLVRLPGLNPDIHDRLALGSLHRRFGELLNEIHGNAPMVAAPPFQRWGRVHGNEEDARPQHHLGVVWLRDYCARGVAGRAARL